jgi:hypothetical protein
VHGWQSPANNGFFQFTVCCIKGIAGPALSNRLQRLAMTDVFFHNDDDPISNDTSF